MSAHVSLHVAGRGRAVCYAYGDQAPILSAWADEGVTVSISSGTRDAVSAEHVAFARELAAAMQRYAEECARFAGQVVGEAATEPRSAA